MRYCDLSASFPRSPFGARRPMHQKANTSKAPVYRLKFVAKAAYPSGTLAVKDAVIPKIEPVVWRTFEEPLDEDSFTDRIVEHVNAGGSACVLGHGNRSVCARFGRRPKSKVCRWPASA